MSKACSQSFEQWAIIGPTDDQKRHFAPFEDAMGGGSVSLETMGPDVTAQLRSECQRLTEKHGTAISDGYAKAEAPTGFKLRKTLTDLTGTCGKKKKKQKKEKKNKKKKKEKDL